MEARKNKLSFLLFMLLLMVATIADVISIVIPLIGSLVVFVFRLVFLVVGVNSFGVNGGMILGAVIEAIPAVSVLPSAIGYVVFVYMSGFAKEELGKVAGTAEEEGQKEGRRKGERESPSEKRERELAQARERRNVDSYGNSTVREKNKPSLRRPISVSPTNVGENEIEEGGQKEKNENSEELAPIFGGETRFRDNRAKIYGRKSGEKDQRQKKVS
jgi:hypothetical protein